MGSDSAITWTDHTFNPWWGCERVSPGCQHCYAETFAKRTGHTVWGKGARRRFTNSGHWQEPFKWRNRAAAGEPGVLGPGQPHLVFCASMADLFEDRDDHVPDRNRVFTLIELTSPHLVWQLLTKRPENVLRLVDDRWPDGWPDNVWIGTTVEDQRRAEERIPHLLDIPARVRFLSCEPLLEAVDLDRPEWLELELQAFGAHGAVAFPRVDWIIAGGESGPRHRPLDLDHARSLRAVAEKYSVPFFFKQVGGRWAAAGGDVLDGEIHKAFPL